MMHTVHSQITHQHLGLDEDGKVVVDQQILNWIQTNQDVCNNGYNHGSKLWDSQWQADQGPTW